VCVISLLFCVKTSAYVCHGYTVIWLFKSFIVGPMKSYCLWKLD